MTSFVFCIQPRRIFTKLSNKKLIEHFYLSLGFFLNYYRHFLIKLNFRLLSSSIQNSEPQIPEIPSAPQYQPSRRREEAKALQNLRRRLNAAKIVQANKPEPIEARSCANNNLSPEETDNRPYLLQKVSSYRQVKVNFPLKSSIIVLKFIWIIGLLYMATTTLYLVIAVKSV